MAGYLIVLEGAWKVGVPFRTSGPSQCLKLGGGAVVICRESAARARDGWAFARADPLTQEAGWVKENGSVGEPAVWILLP